jgi:dipeptidyl aminopeptidase/acylaminoacyl peptidase
LATTASSGPSARSALVFDAVQQAGGRWNIDSQIWSVAYPSGALRRINSDDASYTSVAATAGGRSLVAVRDDARAGLWVAPDGDAARARPIVVTSNGLEGAGGIDWVPDGRIVYSARTQGSIDIWIANADGRERRQLTSDPGLEAQPHVLPDGQRIVYNSRASGTSDVLIHEIGLDGTNPHRIETGGGIFRGAIQVLSGHVYFRALTEGRLVDYRVPIGGGPREPLFADRTRLPPRFRSSRVSPDERWAAGTYAEPQGAGIAVVPIDGQGPVRRIPYTHARGDGFTTAWAPGGQAIEDLVLRDGVVNLWRFPLDGSPPRPVTTFASEQIINYRWSPDGKTLALSRMTETYDVVLITSDGKKE